MKTRLVLAATFLVLMSAWGVKSTEAAFRFISTGDTKTGLSPGGAATTLEAVSKTASGFNPAFLIYIGDLQDKGFNPAAIDIWKSAMNGGNTNTMFDRTFVVRGNHDNNKKYFPNGEADWRAFFDIAGVGARVGVRNLAQLSEDMTYSFDYDNAHFVGIDVPGDVTLMTAAEIAWVDNDLTAAEARGLTHAFLYWHGPVYPLAEHCCPENAAVTAMLSRHPIVSATFHGHEHVFAWRHIDSSRVANVSRPFEEFVTGDAGAGPDNCKPERVDACPLSTNGLAVVDVSGASFTVRFVEKNGAEKFNKTFTKGSNPLPTGTVTQTPTLTVTTTGTPTGTRTPTPMPTLTITTTVTPRTTTTVGGLLGDANGDKKVDGADYSIWLANYGKTTANKASDGDFNNSGRVDGVDYVIWLNSFGKTKGGGTVTATATISRTPTPSLTGTPTVTQTPIPTGTPTPTIIPTTTGKGIWISREELVLRPMAGAAWSNVKSAADGTWGSANLADQDSHHPQYVLAGAIVYVRTGQAAYKDKVTAALKSIIGTESGARSLALGRNLAAYAVAADLVGYQDSAFVAFMANIRSRNNSEGRSITSCHEERPNNWGTMCGASRIAIDAYIGDKIDLDRAAKVFKGYVGDRTSYTGFQFQQGAFTWMCDSASPRPINPVGCSKNGHDLSGAPVDDVQRGGTFTWPPSPTNYAWGGFSAAVAQAEMLFRAGYDSYNWENQAIKRGMNFIQTAMSSSGGGPTDWIPWIVNYRYGTNFAASSPTGWGRLMGWTDWTHTK